MKTTIRQALTNYEVRSALGNLTGCPIGGWPETHQAFLRLRETLPLREDRDFTVDDLVDAALEEAPNGRYRWRDGVL